MIMVVAVADAFVHMVGPVVVSIMVMVMVVIVIMAMVVAMVVGMGMEMEDVAAADALDQHEQADDQDQRAGNQAQVAMQCIVAQGHPVRGDLGGNGEQDNAECVGHGHDHAQEKGVHFPAPGAHQVGCNHRLAVAGFQGVHAAEQDCRQVVDDVLHGKGPLG